MEIAYFEWGMKNMAQIMMSVRANSSSFCSYRDAQSIYPISLWIWTVRWQLNPFHFSVLTDPSLSRFTMPLSPESRLSSRMIDRSALSLCALTRVHPIAHSLVFFLLYGPASFSNNQCGIIWLLGREEKVSLQFRRFLPYFDSSAAANIIKRLPNGAHKVWWPFPVSFILFLFRFFVQKQLFVKIFCFATEKVTLSFTA